MKPGPKDEKRIHEFLTDINRFFAATPIVFERDALGDDRAEMTYSAARFRWRIKPCPFFYNPLANPTELLTRHIATHWDKHFPDVKLSWNNDMSMFFGILEDRSL